MLEQYCTLSSQAEKSQATNTQLEAERASLRSDVANKDVNNRKLQEKVDMLDRECQQVSISSTLALCIGFFLCDANWHWYEMRQPVRTVGETSLTL